MTTRVFRRPTGERSTLRLESPIPAMAQNVLKRGHKKLYTETPSGNFLPLLLI